MTEGYFTAGNITEKAKAIIEASRAGATARDAGFTPERSALLVIDMQRYFLDASSHAFIPSAIPIVKRIRGLAEGFIGRGLPVILTRHINTDENAGMLSRWWSDLIREDDPLSAITGELCLPGAITLRKTQYDAFHGTELDHVLKDHGAEGVVVTGVMTHLCCETTARAAFVRGFYVYFAVDGTATYNEAYHRATVLNLSHGFAVPVLTEDVAARLAG
jgi:bifunctional isochorismate lyase/aryl carrier protein